MQRTPIPTEPPGAAAARRDLARLVGDDAVAIPVRDRTLLQDATETRGVRGEALGAVFPGSTAEVARVVRWCARAGGPARKSVETLDLVGLVCGSEGTLGVITAAWLRLQPRPEAILPVVGLYPDRASAVAALQAGMASGCVPTALEYLDAVAMRSSAATYPRGAPPDGAHAVLAEASGTLAAAEAERALLREALAEGALAVDVPATPPEAAALATWRAGVSLGVLAVRGGKLSEDFAVPFERIGEALDMVERIGAEHGVRVATWGHAGDGNLHASVLADPADPAEMVRAQAAADAFLAIPVALGGSLSGEHGIGSVKLAAAAALPEPVLRAQRAVARALDPAGLANPGRKLPPVG